VKVKLMNLPDNICLSTVKDCRKNVMHRLSYILLMTVIMVSISAVAPILAEERPGTDSDMLPPETASSDAAGTSVCPGGFKAVPAFSLTLGDDKPEAVGTATDEAKIINYDRFWFPASFQVFEQENLVLILDSNRNRIARFTIDGSYKGETPLPFDEHPIDMAFFPAKNQLFVIFQSSNKIGSINFEPGQTWKITDKRLLKCEIPGNLQKIWPASPPDSADTACHLMVSDVEGLNIVVEVAQNGDSDRILGRHEDHGSAATLPFTGAILDLSRIDAGAFNNPTEDAPLPGFPTGQSARNIELRNAMTGELESLPIEEGMLPEQEAVAKNEEAVVSCRDLRPVGGDRKGNIYLEAQMGIGDDAITENWIYRLAPGGMFIERGRLPIAPEMLTNRHLVIDASGAAWYMRKNQSAGKVEFFRVVPDESD